ncbi:MAG: signal peptidase I [Candidatus Moranbacteria bacterium]|nr:signal peptidase I [Candidatus Moranbacteria bacterium]
MEKPEHRSTGVQEPGEEYLGIGGLFMEMLRVFLLAVVIIIPVRVFLVQPFFVQGSSMEPNFQDGQYLVISELGYKETPIGWGDKPAFVVTAFKEVSRQDVMVFRFPKNTEEFFIKRVVGLPKEAVEIRRGKVIIYNSEHPDGYILDESAYLGLGVVTSDMARMELGENQYFAMGDNRTASYDSRMFGAIGKDKIIGRVLLRAWPVERLAWY